ncbi:MAG: class I SAM-dependent methyltransferase [Bryobacteraceae bacterium]|jgi:SAM-dependent methyltransferase
MTTHRTQGFFHQYAGNFDAIYSNRGGLIDGLLNNLFRRSMKLRFVYSVERCSPIHGKTVLDVGCGPGHYAITLAQRGAERVLGIDFADGMLKIAEEHARQAGVGSRCEFRVADFLAFSSPRSFDYVILMGFMDYMSDPRKVIEKALSLSRSKVLLSFPMAGGLLAWQRKLRYRSRCDLYLYRRDELEALFGSFDNITYAIEPIARDFFVTVNLAPVSAPFDSERRLTAQSS